MMNVAFFINETGRNPQSLLISGFGFDWLFYVLISDEIFSPDTDTSESLHYIVYNCYESLLYMRKDVQKR